MPAPQYCTVLAIENVSKKFRGGNFGVRDLSLEVRSGVIGLLGPNGAGKTTLMHAGDDHSPQQRAHPFPWGRRGEEAE